MFLSKNYLLAATDIMLIENENNTVDLIVDSDTNVYLPAIDIKIHYSENLEITEDDIVIAENMCQVGEDIKVNNNTISIECFNDDNTSASGTFATINYVNNGFDDYYFYIDTESLDIGNLEYAISDINKPVNIVRSETIHDEGISIAKANQTENKSFLDRVKNFLIEHQIYTLLIVASIIGLATVIVAIIPTRKKRH